MNRFLLVFTVAIGTVLAQDAAVSMHMNLHHTVEGDIQVSEVRVPSGAIWKDTYYESIGIRSNEALNVGHGYAGIQESSDGRGNRTHIFSLWDEAAVNYIPHLDYGMQTETFGGEGNGSKTWCLTSDESHPLYWQPDVWYTHVIRAWSVGNHTHYGFFVRDGVSEKWRHLSTIGMPHANIRINSGSKNDAFLENWTEHTHDGSYKREMHLRNSMRRDLAGNWETAQKAYYSVNSWDFTDASKRSYNWRTNWDAGTGSDATGSYYKMITGGTATSPNAPLSYTNSVFQTRFDIQNSNSHTIYDAISLKDILFTDLGNGTMEVQWDRDSTTLPQLNYSINVYDNESLSGSPLVTKNYVYSNPKEYNAPNKNSDTISIVSLDMNNIYYLAVEVTDIFDNVTVSSTPIGNGTVKEFLRLTSPDGGKSFMVNEDMTITWNSNIVDDSCEIALLENGIEVEMIGREALSKKSFTWTIPSDISEGNRYAVAITAVSQNELSDTSDIHFTIAVPDSSYFVLDQSLLSVYSFDSEQPGDANAAENVLDGNPTTIWHTSWSTDSVPPHEIVLKSDLPYRFTGLRYLPRQDGANGRIGQYEIYVSNDPNQWGSAVAEGTFESGASEQEILLTEKKGQYIKLRALTEQGGQAFTSVAELNLLHDVTMGEVSVSDQNVRKDAFMIVGITSKSIRLNMPQNQLYTVSLIQINGRTILSRKIEGGTAKVLSLPSGLARGVYLLSIIGDKKEIFQKVTIQ